MPGLALTAWKYPRATRDVDLVICSTTQHFDPLVAALAAASFRARHQPAVRPLGAIYIAQFDFDPPDAFLTIPTDVLLVDSDYHRAALTRCVPLVVSDIAARMQVLSCEDLILHKLLAGRMIDRSDGAALIRANRQSIDVEYLRKSAASLGIKPELDAVWNEAASE